MKNILFSCAALLLTLLLGGARSTDPAVVTLDSDAARSVLAYARTDSALALQAYAWRDFMPGARGCAAPEARSLRMNVTVRGNSLASLPAGARISALSVRYADELWLADAQPSSDCGTDSACVAANARGGPAWPTGARVLVIARVTLPSGHESIVTDSLVEIVRTE
ncbi:MAG: hypothetical protein HOP12_07990 [Candidatus Eisenbacteria bacterium]|uniref:Uncharacterized protein n=1 Tax=Eiseniibacteriota bacterium TaxID=2212470 RepID=A0A849SQ55_UNCEI|nr:hypothetical protein [Candidatus Eisenbacteria bacterium]